MTAERYLSAELAPRRGGPIARAWRFLLALLGGVFGLGIDDGPATLDLVVRRKDTGREVMRTVADVGSPAILLDQVREDLRTKSVTEFFGEWKLDIDTLPPEDRARA